MNNIFKTQDHANNSQLTTAQAVAIANQQNTDVQRTGESYVNYGKRICALVHASSPALPPFLHRVYLSEKQRQLNDEQLQQQFKQQLQAQIIGTQTRIAQKENQHDEVQRKMEDVRSQIERLRDAIAELRREVPAAVRTAIVKMWLGLIILIPLTVYLFIFYSSAFYSAFFQDSVSMAMNSGDLGVAMFNPTAIPLAWTHMVSGEGYEFAFIILAPILFLGLGFSLHFIAAKKGWQAMLQAGTLVLITLSFDCILAYKIGESLYEMVIITSLSEPPPYDIGLAVGDPNTWAVIFCGFIAYIIWGIVFDLVYTAYEDSASNKRQIDALEGKIKTQEKSLASLEQQATSIRTATVALQGEEQQLAQRLTQPAIVAPVRIQTCIAEFFTGWISMMDAMGISQQEQQQAQNIYNQAIGDLLSQSNPAQN